ncbi:alpha/beta-hydrolase [Periconia macrospinosa]|uniref:Alpha/beta-hydrolase n=1 Tax=Periconia macrospinosa TaxID=97972 RepID=A0A2V1DY31_9PLEO|nr:alpha/beta-hydrolase [Periconia macrospinosa]
MFLRSSCMLLPVSMAVLSQASSQIPPNCKDFMLSIEASAENWALPSYPNATDVASLARYLSQTVPASNFTSKPKIPVSGTFNISARFCEPTQKVFEREQSVQLLLHGFLSSKSYWHGLDYPNATFDGQYSWAQHAASQGYYTLSIDNLGSGDSDRLDPITVVQFPLQSQILLRIIACLRSGTLTPRIPTKFNTVIMAAHSYGSLHARELTIAHPTSAADAYILTATAWNPLGLNAIVSAATAGSASVVDPSLSHLQPAYMSGRLSAWEKYLYPPQGAVDPQLIAFEKSEFAHTYTVGELASPKLNTTSDFTGPVLLITGRNDVLVCSPPGSNATTDCGVGNQSIPAQMANVYPRAQFGFYVPDKTGHNINLGYSATEAFGAAHMFLEEYGF